MAPRKQFFRHSMLLVLPVLLNMVLAPIIFAYTITYYPFEVGVVYTRPPVYLEAVGSDYVRTSLGVNSTSAYVNIGINTSYIIALTSRSAVYWSNFTTNPFEKGELIPLTGNWSWENGYVILNISSETNGFGGEAVALLNVTLPENYSRIYIEYNFRIAYADTSGWVDTIYLLSDRSSIYTVGVYYNPRYYPLVYLEAWEYNGSWTRLARSYGFGQTNNINESFYDLTSFFEKSTARLGLLSGTDQLLEATGDRSDVVGVGIGGYIDVDYASLPLVVYFDLVIVSIDKPPYWVNVTGLQYGWTVYILDDQGNVVAYATAGPDGVASIDFWQVKFISNATIAVYDIYGRLIAAQRFDWIVGGDVYTLYNPLAEGIKMIVLGAHNNSTRSVVAGLRLENVEITKGQVYELNVSLFSPASGPESNITIVDGSVVYSYSGPVTIYPGYDSYILVYANTSYNTSIVLDLTFTYSPSSGVVVSYPVTIEIHIYDPPPHVGIRGFAVHHVAVFTKAYGKLAWILEKLSHNIVDGKK